MNRIRTAFFGLAALAVSACGPMDVVTRGAPFENTMPQPVVAAEPAADFTAAPEIVSRSAPELAATPTIRSYNVIDVVVNVSRSLEVAKTNSLIPAGDIVWTEDAPGDRHAQVQAILQDAMEIGALGLDGDRDVIMVIDLARFHALSKTARYTVGGGHTIIFDVTLIDPATGVIVEGPRRIDASFPALGGAAALIAERSGLTQKSRITNHLVKVINDEMTADLGETEIAALN
jgi:hypothetical protein